MKGIDQPYGFSHGQGTLFPIDFLGKRMVMPVICQQVPLILDGMPTDSPFRCVVVGIRDGTSCFFPISFGSASKPTDEQASGGTVERTVVLFDELGGVFLDEGRQFLFGTGLQDDM